MRSEILAAVLAPLEVSLGDFFSPFSAGMRVRTPRRRANRRCVNSFAHPDATSFGTQPNDATLAPARAAFIGERDRLMHITVVSVQEVNRVTRWLPL